MSCWCAGKRSGGAEAKSPASQAKAVKGVDPESDRYQSFSQAVVKYFAKVLRSEQTTNEQVTVVPPLSTHHTQVTVAPPIYTPSVLPPPF